MILSQNQSRAIKKMSRLLPRNKGNPPPLSDQGFHLHKGEFRDALSLRFIDRPINIGSMTGKAVPVDRGCRALPHGDFPQFATMK